MKKTMISPSKFIMGEGELGNLGEHIKQLGSKAVIIAHPDDYNRVKSLIEPALAGISYSHAPAWFFDNASFV